VCVCVCVCVCVAPGSVHIVWLDNTSAFVALHDRTSQPDIGQCHWSPLGMDGYFLPYTGFGYPTPKIWLDLD